MRKKSIIIGAAIVAAAVTLFLLANWYRGSVDKQVEREISQNLKEATAQCVRLLQEKIRSNQTTLQDYAGFIGESGYSVQTEEILAMLEERSKNADFERIAVADINGDVYLPDGSIDMNISGREHFQKAMEGKSIVSGLLNSYQDEREIIILSTPIHREGKIIGVLVGRYYVEDINALLSMESFDGKGYSYLAHSSGAVFTHPRNPEAFSGFQDVAVDFSNAQLRHENDLQAMQNAMLAGDSGEVFYTWESTERIMNYTPVGINDWYLLTVVPREIVTVKSLSLFRQAAALVAGVLVLAAGVIVVALQVQHRNRRKLEAAHTELTTVYNALPGGVFRCKFDEAWTVIFANQGFYRFIGYTKEEFEELCGGCMAGVIYPDDLQEVAEAVGKQIQHGTTVINENRLVCKDGSIKWIWINAELKDVDGEKSFYCTFVEITELRKAQEQLKWNQQRYDIVMDQTQDTILEWNLKDRTIYYSKNFVMKFGYEPVTAGFPESFLNNQVVYHQDADAFMAIFQCIEDGKQHCEGEVRIYKADGTYLWCKVCVTAILDEDGTAFKAVGVISDIENQKRELEKVEVTARMDPLTQLWNKKATEEIIQSYLDHETSPAALMVIDVDNFKGVNDNLGHLYGDAVLSEIAHALKESFRETDVVGRVGGDEFVVFLEDITDDRALLRKAEEITATFQRSFGQQANSYEITGSVGVALYPQHGTQFSELFERADHALYYAKRHGKNCYALYSDEVKGESLLQPVLQANNTVAERAEDFSIQKNFREHMTEYIFRILFEYSDVEKAIPILLDLVGKTLGVSRIYIDEFDADGLDYINTFEWCGEGIPSMKDLSQQPVFDWEAVRSDFNTDYIRYFDADHGVDTPDLRWLNQRGSLSALQCAVVENGECRAVIGFEQCGERKYPTKEETETISLLSKIISVFLLRYRDQLTMAATILNQLNCYVYIVEETTLSLLFINKKARESQQGLKAGSHCYKVLRGREEQCPDCPIREMDGKNGVCEKELFFAPAGCWAETSVSFLKWKGHTDTCMICCNDITKYEKRSRDKGGVSQYE